MKLIIKRWMQKPVWRLNGKLLISPKLNLSFFSLQSSDLHAESDLQPIYNRFVLLSEMQNPGQLSWGPDWCCNNSWLYRLFLGGKVVLFLSVFSLPSSFSSTTSLLVSPVFLSPVVFSQISSSFTPLSPHSFSPLLCKSICNHPTAAV